MYSVIELFKNVLINRLDIFYQCTVFTCRDSKRFLNESVEYNIVYFLDK